MHGFQKLSRLYYFKDNKLSLTLNNITIRLLLIIILIHDYIANIIDLKGVFFLGHFHKREELFMEIFQGFKKYFSKNKMIKLLVPIYRSKQIARVKSL